MPSKSKLTTLRRFPSSSRDLTRDDWVEAGLVALVRAGIRFVAVERLAEKLNVTKGSFYYHFRDREALLEAMLAAWISRNTKPFENVLSKNAENPLLQFQRFSEIWLDPKGFDPRLDAAIREWGRSDKRVSRQMRETDAFRMTLLKSIFIAMGYKDTESEVRARITYYHQVGYYLLDLEEDQGERQRLFPHYHRVLAGFPPVSSA
jgi:AcrR family transcriptional regulator